MGQPFRVKYEPTHCPPKGRREVAGRATIQRESLSVASAKATGSLASLAFVISAMRLSASAFFLAAFFSRSAFCSSKPPLEASQGP